MSGAKQLIHCQERKAALLKQSTANRVELLTGASQLSSLAECVDLGISVVRQAGSVWNVLAPILSLWGTRKGTSPGFVHKLAGVTSLVRSLVEAWKGFRRAK